jgi:putative membrane protein
MRNERTRGILNKTKRNYQEGELWKGAIAGVAGGLAGAFTMMMFQTAWSKSAEAAGADELADQTHRHERAQQDATAKVASITSRKFTGKQLRGSKRKAAASAVHFGFAALIGGLYGALAESIPMVTTGFGTAYGAAVFAAADELALPRLGLSKQPENIPPAMHALGLSSHAVYGATLETVRRALRERF